MEVTPPHSPDLPIDTYEKARKLPKREAPLLTQRITRAQAREAAAANLASSDPEPHFDDDSSSMPPKPKSRKPAKDEPEALYAQIWLNNMEYVQIALPKKPPRVLPQPDLRLIIAELTTPERFSDVDLTRWLLSNDTLPIVNNWYKGVKLSSKILASMRESFAADRYPFAAALDMTLRFARQQTFTSHNLPHYSALAQHANKLMQSNTVWFDSMFIKYELDLDHKLALCIAVLVTAWLDLEMNGDAGFFGVLLESKLATPRYPHVRNVLDM